jgi:hypothetical protein
MGQTLRLGIKAPVILRGPEPVAFRAFACDDRRVRLVIDFDGTFSTCQGKVMHGKESGKNKMRQVGLNNQPVEVQSVSVSGVSCAIKEGNALGGS